MDTVLSGNSDASFDALCTVTVSAEKLLLIVSRTELVFTHYMQTAKCA
jgi:hypothetical protein